MGPKKKKTESESKDEAVNELVRAAEDEMLVKLSINSHMSHFSDLERRFQALKSSSSPCSSSSRRSAKTGSKPQIQSLPTPPDGKENDIWARFAALKGTVSTSKRSADSDRGSSSDRKDYGKSNKDDDDEVEKVIKWAMDAARLDPSSPSESDIDNGDEDEVEDNGDSDVKKS